MVNLAKISVFFKINYRKHTYPNKLKLQAWASPLHFPSFVQTGPWSLSLYT